MVRTTVLAALATLVLPLAVAVTHSPVASAVAATCAGKPATIVVPESPTGVTDPVTGTPGDDVVVGSSGDDTIDGAGGDDTICGLAGSDILVGGPGNDRLLGGLDGDFDPDYGYYGVEGVFGDVVVPGPGDDHVDLGADPRQGMPLDDEEEARADRISYDSAQAGVVVNLTRGTARGQGVDTIAVNTGSPVILVGSPHDDHLIGNDDLTWIAAGGGDDRVEGRGRNDMIWLDRGDVWLSSDTPVLPGDDVADGGRSNDDINSDGGKDVLRGGPGRDDLDARQPGATLHGGPGGDSLGVLGGGRLYGGAGDDRLSAEVSFKHQGVFAGGPGDNDLYVTVKGIGSRPRAHIRVDMPARRITLNDRHLAHVTSIRSTYVWARRGRVTFIGTPRRDIFNIGTGLLRLRAYGRGGPDFLIGGDRPDLLDGGPGSDTLHGGRGRDRCVRGERFRSCEVRR